jgi:hypothetical protein
MIYSIGKVRFRNEFPVVSLSEIGPECAILLFTSDAKLPILLPDGLSISTFATGKELGDEGSWIHSSING